MQLLIKSQITAPIGWECNLFQQGARVTQGIGSFGKRECLIRKGNVAFAVPFRQEDASQISIDGLSPGQQSIVELMVATGLADVMP